MSAVSCSTLKTLKSCYKLESHASEARGSRRTKQQDNSVCQQSTALKNATAIHGCVNYSISSRDRKISMLLCEAFLLSSLG